uniref:Uncharacterized protein n=1 Tax=Caenorhabditis japonica TaxID=281687 RepID=A0A8R1I4V0_CAEJA
MQTGSACDSEQYVIIHLGEFHRSKTQISHVEKRYFEVALVLRGLGSNGPPVEHSEIDNTSPDVTRSAFATTNPHS